jgi:hypothetical protein
MPVAASNFAATKFRLLTGLLLAGATLFLQGCGCGFDCNNGNNPGSGPAFLSLGFSDEALEELKQVVIEVDAITFTRSGAEDVVVETFTIEDLDLTNAESFQVDLLQYRGLNQLLVIDSLEMDATTYGAIKLTLLDRDVNLSYVQESDDSLKQLNISGTTLDLPGMRLSSGDEAFTLVFSLAQALQYQESSDDYLLASDGIRVQDNTTAASLSGRVDSDLFDTQSPCDAKEDPELGNRIYLYEGSGLSTDRSSDVFTTASTTEIPDDAVMPFSVATLLEDALTGNWQYVFGFLPAGDYTLAFSCDTADDDPVNYDGYVIPLPTDQSYDISLDEGEKETCDLNTGAAC